MMDQHSIEDFREYSISTKAKILQQFGFHVNHEIDADYNLLHVYALHSYFVILKIIAPLPDERVKKPIMEWDSEIEAYSREMMEIIYPRIKLDTPWISNLELSKTTKKQMKVSNAKTDTFKINFISN